MLDRLKRLKEKEPGEILSSLIKRVEKPLVRILYYRGMLRPLPSDLASILENGSPVSETVRNAADTESVEEGVCSWLLGRTGPAFYSFAGPCEEDSPVFEKYLPGSRAKTFDRAEMACRHEFGFFGSRYKFDDAIDWHLDYTTGKKWPEFFCADIPYRDLKRTGDIKYPWELSRHQHFIALGKAYWHTGDEKFAEEFVTQTVSWIRSNPLYRGIHWISPLETAIRIIAWIWAYYFFRSSPRLTPEFISEFTRSIWVQLKFIEKNLSPQSYANNHLIGEAAGLFVGGIFLEGFKRAGEWAGTGKDILINEIEKQTHPDGVNVEQAVSYQRFVMDFFVLFKVLHEQNIGPLPEKTDDRLERMFEYLMIIIRPDGQAPQYGDSDNARGIELSEENPLDYRGILSVGAVLFSRGDMKFAAGGVSEEVFWLKGLQGVRAFSELRSEEPGSLSALFRDGGYCVFRESWEKDSNYLLFDCGPLGYRSGAHGHADALSVQLISFGSEALADPGTFAYNQAPELRNYFRSTAAHNTVSVDGEDQARIVDRMSWENIPVSRINDYYTSDRLDIISAETDGYKRLSSPVTHRRTVVFLKDPAYYLIIDRLDSSGVHDYAQHFHFPPGADIKGENPLSVMLPGNGGLFMQVKSSFALTSEIKEGEAGGTGWYSRMYGHIERSHSVTFRCRGEGTTFLFTLLIPLKEKELSGAEFDVHTNKEGEFISIVVEKDGIKDTLFLNSDTDKASCGNISFAGKTALIRQKAGGELIFAFGREVTFLRVDEKLYFESGIPKDGYIVNNIEKEVI